MAPPTPERQLHSLPPILRRPCPNSMPNCSKAPRGLFVLLRVTRIFTRTSISPGPLLRQRPDRYTFRAGRNLPDKEFRYLRTVIVTAAVHRGFGSKLAPLPLTFRHWADVSPYTAPCGLAETCGFVNQSLEPFHCDLPSPTIASRLNRHPFSRSYGAKLPSSLTRVLPFALVYSTRLPVSVCGTGTQTSPLRSFSRQSGLTTSASRARIHASARSVDFPADLKTYALTPAQPIAGWSTSLRPLIALSRWFRNVDRMSITYAFQPQLRTD